MTDSDTSLPAKLDPQDKKDIHAAVKRDVLKEVELETRKFGQTAFASLGTYMAAAFGLVVGLAWNNAVQALINYYVPNKGNSITIQFAYAACLTLAVVAATYVIVRLTHRNDEKK